MKAYYALVHSFNVVVYISVVQPSDSEISSKTDWLKMLLENNFPYFVFSPVLIQVSKKKIFHLLLSLLLITLLLLYLFSHSPHKQWIHHFSPLSSNADNKCFSNLWLLFISGLQWLSKIMTSTTLQTITLLNFNYMDQPNCSKCVSY